jgi:hypothetical protein
MEPCGVVAAGGLIGDGPDHRRDRAQVRGVGERAGVQQQEVTGFG